MVPYRTALVPEAPVAHIPHMEALAPGSTGNQRPSSLTKWFNPSLASRSGRQLNFFNYFLYTFSRIRDQEKRLPHIEALVPGSTGNQRPSSLIKWFNPSQASRSGRQLNFFNNFPYTFSRIRDQEKMLTKRKHSFCVSVHTWSPQA